MTALQNTSLPRLLGVGTALPPHWALQTETARVHALLSGLDEAKTRTLRALYRRSGVERRYSVLLERAEGDLLGRQAFYHPSGEAGTGEDGTGEDGTHPEGPSTSERMALYEQWAPRLASEAGERALASAGVEGSQVTHLVTVSCTGFYSPGVDLAMVEALGLPRTVERTHVGFMGCHAALNGLRVARGFTAADPDAVVLMAAVELCSLHYAYQWDPELLVANALFGDGAGAVVVAGSGVATRSPASPSTSQEVSGVPPEWRIASNGTILLESSQADMTWRIGDHGFLMTLSPSVPERIAEAVRPWLDEWLGRAGLGVEDVATWAVHPGGPRILGAVEEAAGLDRSATELSREVLAGHGNMSSATILFILERLRAENAPLPAVALAFGPGLAAEGMLIVNDEP